MVIALTKSFNPIDYDELSSEVAVINEALGRLDGQYDMQHEHRRWEYAIALKAIYQIFLKMPDKSSFSEVSILDVGSGDSPFPAILKILEYNVISSDVKPRPHFYDKWPVDVSWLNLLEEQPSLHDIVTCISVIEHVEDDIAFLEAYWKNAKYGMILTYDCTEEQVKLVPWHLRTYSPLGMANILKALPEAELFGGIDPVYHGRLVHAGGVDGSFGSSAITRKEKK